MDKSDRNGIGFSSLLFLLFVGLKLGDVIDWSWWWVTAPLWLPPVLVFGLIFFIWGLAVILEQLERVFK